MTIRFLAVAATMLAAGAPAPFAAAADFDRGRALYELRCRECHAESVHARKKRVARDFTEVRAWVIRWNSTLRLGWKQDEVDDVALYLNDTYYGYRCPPSVCKVVSMTGAARAPSR